MRNALLILLTLVLYALLYSFSAIMLFVSIVASYLPGKFLLARAIQLWSRGLFLLTGSRLRIHGKENIPSKSNYLILANHTSLFDIPAIMAVFPYVSWLGREYLTRIPLFNHMQKRMNFVAVSKNPGTDVRRIIRQSVSSSSRFTIALFPEGTRTTDGKLQPFKRGFIHIMRGANLDILPVTLNGLFELKPKTRFSIHPFQRCDIIIHPPLRFNELVELSNSEIIERVQLAFESDLTKTRKPTPIAETL